MIDRTKMPKIHTINELNINGPHSYLLENGVKLYHIKNTGDQTFEANFFFDGGTLNAKKNIISSLTGKLLLSGTKEKTNNEIEEAIDFLGGYTGSKIGHEESGFSVVGLVEHAVPLVDIVLDTILHAIFDEKELKQQIQSEKKKLSINLKKVNFIAKRDFMQALFKNSPYGNITKLSDFDEISRESLVDFYSSHYLKGLHTVTLIGELSIEQLETIKSFIVQFETSNIKEHTYSYDYIPQQIHTEREDAVQTAIRIGRILFNKKHPDYFKFTIMNTILGGYFGSRLMTTIREEKGYTYGIGSGVTQLLNSGYFFISTEVNKEYKEATVEAIKKEISLLQKELIDKEELSLVKNYMIGQLLEITDGAQSIMSSFLNVTKYGKTLEYFNQFIKTIHSITPEEIREMAIKYLNWEDMVVVTVG